MNHATSRCCDSHGGLDEARRPGAIRVALLAAVVALACRGPEDYEAYERAAERRAPRSDGVSVGVAVSDARFVATIVGLRNPESVRYDSLQDVFFISNMSGFGSVKDGDGYIVRTSAADARQSSIFIKGGSGGVTLDAPKGMTISGDTLWVADIDKLRGFDRTTGAPLATIDLAPQGATLLNDVAVGPGGIRVTDTGIRMDDKGNYVVGPSRIFAVGGSGAVSVIGTDATVRQPNGITWDPANRRWVVVSFDRFSWNVKAVDADDSVRTLFTQEKQGQLDGVEVLPAGGILYSAWADSSIHLLENGRDRQVIREVIAPADIGLDTRRGRVAVPMPTMGWVQLWSLAPTP